MSLSTTECLASANELLASHNALLSRIRNAQRSYRRQLRSLPSPPNEILKLPLIPTPPRSPSPSPPSSPVITPAPKPSRPDLPPAKRARLARYNNYVPEEETIRNDYSQRYVDGGEWPQNWVLGAEPEHRFEEYPKQQRLLSLKKAVVAEHALPPTYLPYSELSTLHPSKFDVILIDPPFSSSFSWDELQDLPIPALAADPSFVLMWVGSGSGDGLERGREVMAKWGFRRCEDIVWVKTNKTTNRGPGTDPPTTSLLTRTKQHCLMGIRGTVRRSSDSWFVHCNVDTDVLIWEGDPSDPTRKPPEMYTLIENFCLGLRRLELFGRARTARRGWVTVLQDGEEDALALADPSSPADDTTGAGDGERQDGGAVRWDRERWEARIKELAGGGKLVVPVTPEIDALRPKSPVRGGSSNNPGHGHNANMNNMNGNNNAGGMHATPGGGPGMGPSGGGGGRGNNHGHGGGGFGGPNRGGMMGPPQMVPGGGGAMGMMGGGGGPGWGNEMGMAGLGIAGVPMGMAGPMGMSMASPMQQHHSQHQHQHPHQHQQHQQQGMGFGGGGGGQFMDAGMWDGTGMGESPMMSMSPMAGMGGMNGMGMSPGMNGMGAMRMGMNSGMGANMMGMGMGQWPGADGGFDGGFGG
ncbi:MT-A70-domain-containing protein [Trametes polyzona]|nr:MT-A70-domain-containing protein [Trametes polyzona]